jgi:hypothetical protein
MGCTPKMKNFDDNQALKKMLLEARCQCLTLIILATQEAEIRRLTVQGQCGQIVHETPSRKYLE